MVVILQLSHRLINSTRKTSVERATHCAAPKKIMSTNTAFLHATPLRVINNVQRRTTTTPLAIPRLALAPPPARPPARCPPPSERPWSSALVGRDSLELATRQSANGHVVIIVFIASWCRVCRTLLQKVARLANAYPTELTFYTMDFGVDENKPVCSDLGVKLLPTFHIYRNANNASDYLEQFTAGPFGTKNLVDRLNERGIRVRMPRA